MSVQKELLEYKLRIKEWEKSFAKANGRVPSKADVKADQKIYKAYKIYNLLKLKQLKAALESSHSTKSVTQEAPKKDLDPLDFVPVPPELDDESRDDAKSRSLHNTELGPTPQANGKVLSLFDILSPPESSPLKLRKGLPMSSPIKSKEEFKTPTKAVKRIELSDLTPTRNSLVKKSLTSALQSVSTALQVSITQTSNEIVETPFYLGKISNKFRFTNEAKLPLESSPIRGTNLTEPLPQTPSKGPIGIPQFLASPSPFKTERLSSFGMNKKLTDVFNEAISIQIDEQLKQEVELELMIEMQQDEEEEEVVEDNNVPVFRKKKKTLTQKRTTRRWKMKPRSEIETMDLFEGKNVHEEIKKIEARQKEELLEYMEGPVAGGEELESDEDEVFQPSAPSKLAAPANKRKKLTPISNNFQRLKINDPRSKRFKQRMKRR